MSSSPARGSTKTTKYTKRNLEFVPFNSQLEVIDKAILNDSKTLLNSNQYANVHRSGYNNSNVNNINHSHNQNLQNKYALAAVAAAAAVQQQQQNYMLHQQSQQQQSQQQQQQQYKEINPYMVHTQMGFSKDPSEFSSSSSLLSENNAPLPYDFQNFISSSGSNNSVTHTPAPLNQLSAIELQTHPLQSNIQPQIQNLSQPPIPGFIFDPMASDNSKIKPNSPTSLQSQNTATSSKASNNSPPNLFLSTSNSGANVINSANSNNPVTTNFLESPSLLPSVNNISNNWATNSSTTNAINQSSIWGANPSMSSSSMVPSNLGNLDSKSESKISIHNNFGGSMW